MRIPFKDTKKINLKDFVADVKSSVVALNNNDYEELIVTKDGRLPFLVVMKYPKLNLLIDTAVRDQIREIDSVVARSISKVNMSSLSNAQQNLIKIKSKLECFDNMSDADVMQVTNNVEFLQFGANEIIFDQGKEGKNVFYIVRGSVKVFAYNEEERGNFKHLATLSEGNVFGEMSPISGEPRSARTVTATGNTILLTFSFHKEMEEENKKAMFQLYKNFVKIIAKKLVETNNKFTKKPQRQE